MYVTQYIIYNKIIIKLNKKSSTSIIFIGVVTDVDWRKLTR